MITFLRCGMIGWGLEVFWTGLHSLLQGNAKLTGQSSLWMFPIYGMAAFIVPASEMLKPLNIVFRGFVYMLCFFAVEYLSGLFLRERNLCPWDYSDVRWNIDGLIRLDFAPVWFITGLIFEWILCRK